VALRLNFFVAQFQDHGMLSSHLAFGLVDLSESLFFPESSQSLCEALFFIKLDVFLVSVAFFMVGT